MKALKKILLVLLVIIVIVVVVGFFLPRHVHVERSLVIKAHRGLVYNQVIILKNWESWSAWHKLDSAMKLTYAGPSMGMGASYAWESKMEDVGNGELTIVKDVPFDSIGTTMDFRENGKATSAFVFQDQDGGTKVTWSLETDMGPNPFYHYIGLFLEGKLGKEFMTGLENIRKIVEANPNAMLKVEPGTINDIPYLFIREKVSMENIGTKMAEFYGEIQQYTKAKGVAIAGYPFSISYSWANNEFDMADAFPVATAVAGEGRIQSSMIKAGNVIKCDYYGSYEGTGLPHSVVETWIKANNKKLNGQPWEEYITDPMTEPNPEKWLTRVYWPVE